MSPPRTPTSPASSDDGGTGSDRGVVSGRLRGGFLRGQKVRPGDPQVGRALFAGHLLTVFGLALSNALMGFAILWAAWKRRTLTWNWERRAALFVPAGLYVVFFAGSAVASVDRSTSLPELKDILSFATLFLAPALVRGERQTRRLVDLLVGLVALLALHGAAQYYSTDYGELHRRIPGLFSHVQTFSGVLLVGLLAAVARLTRDVRTLWLWAALGMITWTLLLTLTRGPWVAALLTLLGFALVRVGRRRAGRRFPVWAAVGVVLVAILVASAPRLTAERMLSIVDLEDESNYDRLCMAEAALYMVAERPLFGLGQEMVEERYPIYRHPTAPRVRVPHLHSTYLQRAAEQGLLGLGSYLLLVFAALRLAWIGLKHGPRERSDLYLAAFLVIVGFHLAGLFEDNWRDTEVRRLLLFFMALPLCLSEPTLSEPTQSDPASPSPETPA